MKEKKFVLIIYLKLYLRSYLRGFLDFNLQERDEN